MMQKVVTYLYPDISKASTLKVFQDRTTQIKAFYFTRENIKTVEALESGQNYACYFLFDQTEAEEMTKVYVGQSSQGAYRMLSHDKTKMFWSFCIMFVTDNNSFDAMMIDYMEYHFINKLRNSSSYSLENIILRNTEPVISIFDKPTVMAMINQISFLLQAEGINFDNQEMIPRSKVYQPKSKRYTAKLISSEGKFILLEGSHIVRPIETSKAWSDGGRFYNSQTSQIETLIKDKKVVDRGDYYETLVNLTFKSPSNAACLVSGASENGWLFFAGLDELRKQG